MNLFDLLVSSNEHEIDSIHYISLFIRFVFLYLVCSFVALHWNYLESFQESISLSFWIMIEFVFIAIEGLIKLMQPVD
ncbi:hypothetical protein MJH12_03930 [bacterium]|nr:hypothetical protein [bacterium]